MEDKTKINEIKAELIGRKLQVSCTIQGNKTTGLLDTGAQVTLIGRNWLEKHMDQNKWKIHSIKELIGENLMVTSPGGLVPYIGYTNLTLQLGHLQNSETITVPFLVDLSTKQPIIGTNVMEAMWKNKTAKEIQEQLINDGLEETDAEIMSAVWEQRCNIEPLTAVKVQESILIPASTRMEIKCNINIIKVPTERQTLYEPRSDWKDILPELTLKDQIITLDKGENQIIKINMENKSNKDITINKQEMIGHLLESEAILPVTVDFMDMDQVTKQVNINTSSTTDNQKDKNAKAFAETKSEEVDEASKKFFDTLSKMELPELTPDQSQAFKQMLWEERKAFALNSDDIGSAPDLKLNIKTSDNIPVARCYNAIPKHLYKEVQDHLQVMLEKGWIEKSKSAWSSPIVIVKKKGGGFRIAIDYRLLNKKTIPDKHPVPRIQECLDSLQGSSIYTTLDCSRAYYQGYMEEDSRPLTAFSSPWGFYQFVRIPFGLSNAVPIFQRYMEDLMEEFRASYAVPYLDDTIVHSTSIMEHVEQVRKVLRKYQDKGLKLNLKKCTFCSSKVKYLGRIVSAKGWTMDEANVIAVKDLAKREYHTVGEIRQLLGLLNFHRRSVQDFAGTSRPITDLLMDSEDKAEMTNKQQKGVPSNKKIKWEQKHQDALEKLIKQVTNPPIMAFPDYSKPFLLHTDASGHGLGAILYQQQDNDYRVIAYASRSLKPSEKNYHSTKLEFMALKWSVCEHFRDYLAYADAFKVYTDNNPLVYVMDLKKPNATTQRWISELCEYSFKIHYRPGIINRDADCLSRLPLDISKYIPMCKEETSLDTFQAMVAELKTIIQSKRSNLMHVQPELNTVSIHQNTPLSIKEEQIADTYINPVIEILKGGEEIRENLSELSKILLRDRTRLYFDGDDILRRKTMDFNQVVLPLKFKEMIYQTLHVDMGHLGSEKVFQLARQRIYWPKMQDDIEDFTRKICKCIAQKKNRRQPVAPLISIHAENPMQLVAIDFVHLEKSSSGHEYILVVIDHFTRYAVAYPSKDKSATTAAKHLFNDFILKFGLPDRIIHDQGKEFENSLFKNLEKFCGIVKSRTTPYHAQGNGAVERMNSTLLQMLRTLPENQKGKWSEQIDKLMFAYNATRHSSTGFSPHFLMYGREPILPLDVILNQELKAEVQRGQKTYEKFSENWKQQMHEAYNIARQKCQSVKHKTEERWNKRVIATELQPGDKVLVKNKREMGGPGKIRAHWEQEVYQVLERKQNGVVYKVQKLSNKKGEERTLHRNLLLPCEMIEDLQEKPLTKINPKAQQQHRKSQRRTTQPTQVYLDDTSSNDEEDTHFINIQEVEQPIIQEVEQPPIQEVEQPLIQEFEQPFIQEVEQPLIQQVEQPLIQEVEQPSIQQVEQPLIQEFEQPPIQEFEQPFIQEVEQPPIQQVEQPPVPDIEQPMVADGEQPFIPDGKQTNTTSNKHPNATENEQPRFEIVETPYTRNQTNLLKENQQTKAEINQDNRQDTMEQGSSQPTQGKARITKAPAKLTYFKLGGDPMVVEDKPEINVLEPHKKQKKTMLFRLKEMFNKK